MYAVMFAIFGVIEFLAFVRCNWPPGDLRTWRLCCAVSADVGDERCLFSAFIGVAISSACWVYNHRHRAVGGIAILELVVRRAFDPRSDLPQQAAHELAAARRRLNESRWVRY